MAAGGSLPALPVTSDRRPGTETSGDTVIEDDSAYLVRGNVFILTFSLSQFVKVEDESGIRTDTIGFIPKGFFFYHVGVSLVCMFYGLFFLISVFKSYSTEEQILRGCGAGSVGKCPRDCFMKSGAFCPWQPF